MNHSKYQVDLPYPSLDCVEPNINDFKIITRDYAGIASEFSAITQYIYHHFYALKDNHPEISETLMGISVAEMHHLDILGSLIIKLGGSPKFFSICDHNNISWWSGDYINYSSTIKKIILSDIAGEEAAIRKYLLHSKMVSQKSVSDVLMRIVLDEKLHLEILNNILDSL